MIPPLREFSADILENVSEAEERERQSGIEHSRRALCPDEYVVDDLGFRRCLDCDVVIPPDRVKVVNACRCVKCQTFAELLPPNRL